MKKAFIRISEDGKFTKFDGDNLDALQKAVGGWITTAPITHDGLIPGNVTAYADDEGLLKGCAYNATASTICGYQLVGPVVIRATKSVLAKLGGFGLKDLDSLPEFRS